LALHPLYDPALDPDGDQVDENGRAEYAFENVLDKPRATAPSFHRLSPRLGVSFPITPRSAPHFHYGPFFQPPPPHRTLAFGYFRPVYIVECQYAYDHGLPVGAGTDYERCTPGRTHAPSAPGDPERVVALSPDDLKPEKTVSFEVGL